MASNTVNNTRILVKSDDNHLNHFIAGEVAGIFSAIVSHPLDTLKTRMQIEMIKHNIEHTNNTYNISVPSSKME